MSKLEMVLKESKLKELVLELFSMQKLENIDEFLQRKIIRHTVEDIFDEVIDANMREWGFVIIDKNLIISLIPEKIEVDGFVFDKGDNEHTPNLHVKYIEKGILLQFKGPHSDVLSYFKSVGNFYQYVRDMLYFRLKISKLI